jgi:hypothetical protein
MMFKRLEGVGCLARAFFGREIQAVLDPGFLKSAGGSDNGMFYPWGLFDRLLKS